MGRKIDSFDPDKLKEGQFLVSLEPNTPNIAETLYAHPGNHVEVTITGWALSNHNNKDIVFNLFFDNTGANYNDSTRVNIGNLNKDTGGPAGALIISMIGKTGTIGFEADDVDCTMTLWGTIKPRG